MAEKQLTADAKNMLGDPKTALRLMAVPMFVSLMVAQVNTFVDTFWCSSLGTIALAAVGIVTSFYLILSGIGSGIGIGISASVAAKVATRRKEEADNIASVSIKFMFVIGLLCIPIMLLIADPVLMAVGGTDTYDDGKAYGLPYYLGAPIIILQGIFAGILRGEGASRRSMVMMVTAAVLNIVLDPLFTFVFDWGICGLSWATVTSTAASLLLFLYWYYVKPETTYIDLHVKSARMEKHVLKDFLSVGVPKAVESDIMAAVNFVLNYFVVFCWGSYGYAVYATSWKYVDLMLVPSVALAGALVPIAAAAFSKHDFPKMRFSYGYAMAWTLIITAVIAAVLYVFMDYAAIIFTYSEGSIAMRADIIHVTKIFLIIGVLFSAINISSSLLQAMRMANNSMWSTFARNILLIFVFGATCTISPDAMWWGFVLCEIVGLVIMCGWAEIGYKMRLKEYKHHSETNA